MNTSTAPPSAAARPASAPPNENPRHAAHVRGLIVYSAVLSRPEIYTRSCDRFPSFPASEMQDAMSYSDQSDPTVNPQFLKFWGARDRFFRRTSPSDLDREADRMLAEGNTKLADILAFRAAAMREVTR